MKKKLLVGFLSLGMISLLCGFDSAQTADTVLDSMQKASSEADNMSMDMAMNMDISIDVGDGTTTSTLAVGMDGGFQIDYLLNPLSMMMDGNFSISAMGQNQDMARTMYVMANEDGTVDSYVYTEDAATGEAGWEHSSSDMGISMEELMEMQGSITAADYAEWGLTFELAPEAADVDGTECYLLSTTIDAATLDTMLNKVAELSGASVSEEDLSAIDEALAYLDGLAINLEYYVDAATFLPVQMHMDFNSSDLGVLNDLIASSLGEAAEGTTVTVNLTDFSIDAAMSYDTVADISVPQEAIDSATEAINAAEDALADDLATLETAAAGESEAVQSETAETPAATEATEAPAATAE